MMTLGCAAAVLTVVLAQPPDFSGTWMLDPDRSTVESAAALTGLIGAGAPDALRVTQPANGSILVESHVNESHARVYIPGAESSTPVFVGGIGKVTMTTRWEGEKLVSEGRRVSAAGTSTVVTEVREVFGLSADGSTLEIEVTVAGAEGKSTSTMRYTRIQSVGTCDSWPTPCKPPSR